MIRTALAATALAVLLVPKVAPEPKASSAARLGQWNLQTAGRFNANLASGEFSAPQHVTLTRADGSVIVADRASGNYKQKQAMLYGHVSVHDAGGTFGLQSAAKAQSRGPATLTADQLHVDEKTHLYDATGNVHYERADIKVDAQEAHLNDLTHVLNLSGKVHAVQADRTLEADRATYNTVTGDGTAENNVTVMFPGAPITIATPRPIVIKHPKIP